MPDALLHNEQQLLFRLAAGDEAAYRQLFDMYWRRIYANAQRFTKDADMAQDMAQEVFIKIWTKREKLAEVNNLENYLYFIARNVFLDYLRKKVLDASNSLYLDTWFEDAAAWSKVSYD